MKAARNRVRLIGPSLVFGVALGFVACTAAPPPTDDLLAVSEEQMKLRTIQTRDFDIEDRRQAMRGVVAALQDLGFIVERANEPMGLVSAARFAEPNFYNVVGVTVTVRQTSATTTTIRINAIFNNAPVTDSKVYQNFFATLQKSMFIGR